MDAVDALSEDFFETAPCEICGANERLLVAERPDLFLGGDRLYQMHQCQKCGVVYQHPRPKRSEMAYFYGGDYQPYTPAVHTESRLARFSRRYGLRKRCQVVTRHVERGTLLDVGCATGDFLSEMRRQPGWSVVGIEPSHNALTYARAEVNLDVVEGVLNESPFAAGSFDAITMWDVLEHVYDPAHVIRQAAALLRPGGLMVINHPNLRSLDRRLFGNLWLGYELPRHLYLFPAELLRRLMADAGLVEVEQRSVYGSHAATSTSLGLVVNRYIGQGQLSRLLERVLFSKAMRLVLFPYFWIEDTLHRGSNITAVFQKPT